MSEGDLLAVWLTLKLAACTTAILLLLSPLLAWWLSRSQHRLRPLVEVLVALPLVLRPPCSVLSAAGLLPGYGLGDWWRRPLAPRSPSAFSACSSPPSSIRCRSCSSPSPPPSSNMGNKELEAAATLGFGPLERFFHIILPMTLPQLQNGGGGWACHTLGSSGSGADDWRQHSRRDPGALHRPV